MPDRSGYGTSKCNKIEHRMFCHITQNWRGQPLESRAAVIELIANTTTKTGQKVECTLDERTYEKGIRISNAQMRQRAIEGDAFLPGWNYTIKPRMQPTLRVAYMNWGLLNGATSPTMIVLAISGLSTASPSQRRSSGGGAGADQSRDVTSWTSHVLPSGSLKHENDL
jgi:hypothetical protein